MIVLRGIAQLGVAVRGIAERGIAGVGAIFNPLSLNPLQYLKGLLAPSSIIDLTPNDLKGLARDSNGTVTDGLLDVLTLDTEIVTQVGDRVCFTLGMISNPAASSIHRAFNQPSSGVDMFGVIASDDGRIYVRAVAGSIVISASSYLTIADGTREIGFQVVSATETDLYVDGVFAETIAVNAIGVGTKFLADNTSAADRGVNANWVDFRVIRAGANIVHYDFAGGLGAGLEFLDKSGNANNATASVGAGGVATLRSGLTNYAHPHLFDGHSKTLYFNGTDAEAQYTNATINATWDISVRGFFNNVSGEPIWSKADGAGASTDIAIDVSSSSVVRGFFYSSGVAKLTTATMAGAFDGNVHTIRYVNTGTTQTLYLDGTPIGTPTTLTDTPDNDTSVCNICSRNGAAFGGHTIVSVDDGFCLYEAESAYIDATGEVVVPCLGGGDVATGINVAERYYSALDDGTNDTGSLGITNPAATFGNNSENTFQQDVDAIPASIPETITITGTGTGTDTGYALQSTLMEGKIWWTDVTDLSVLSYSAGSGSWRLEDDDTGETWLVASTAPIPPKVWPNIGDLGSPAPALAYLDFFDNEFWSADGSTYDKKTWCEMITHINWTNLVLVKSTSPSSIEAVLTWAQGTIVTPRFWELMTKWLGTIFNPTLEPEYDLDGTIEENLDGSVELVQPE